MRWLAEWSLIRLICCLFFFAISGCTATSYTNSGEVDGELKVIDEEICQEVRTGKMWQTAKKGMFFSYKEAGQYAANLSLGGYDDWRLPSKDELFDIYYMFYWEKNGNCTMNRTGNFWAVSDEGDPLLGHWETHFLCNPEPRYVKSKGAEGYVRAVRP